VDFTAIQNLLARGFYQNSLLEWAVAILLAVVVYVVVVQIKRFAARRLRKATEAEAGEEAPAAPRKKWGVAAADAIARTAKLFILVVALYAGAYVLTLPPALNQFIQSILVVALFIQIAIWASGIMTTALDRYAREHAAPGETITNALSLIKLFARLTVWSVALLLILDNLGFDITALVAGFGIGGIAIALAAQNILGDLFASLSIVLDKPFVNGDFIIFGDHLGTIERIGLKTTRIRSLSGEEIICANTDLLNSRIRNYKRMWERRIVFGLGVVYQTPADKLEQIPTIIREAVEAQDGTRFDRAHFKGFGNFSLDFEVVYWVLSPDYNVYMDLQQAINLHIFRRFAEEGIEFAYPTQTLYLEGGEAGQTGPVAPHFT